MPDWTYHPFFKPLLFQLPAEFSRRLTLTLLEIQARTAPGRWVFKLFGHGLPPDYTSVNVFGLRFPGPIGLAPGIDIDGTAVPVMQHLGFGFIEVGPIGAVELPRKYSTDPLRIVERHSLICSPYAAGPSAATIATRIKSAPDLSIPIGIALRGELSATELIAAIEAARDAASFFTLPASCDPALFSQLRSLTTRPLLLRISPDWSADQLNNRIEAALNAGINGCVAVSGRSCPLLPGGEMDGPFLHQRALEVVRHIWSRYGERFPVIGAGGIMTPDDAMALLDAGAKLVELYSGLVYSGPGLPGRILHRVEHRINSKNEIQSDSSPPTKAAGQTEIREPAVSSGGQMRSRITVKLGWPLMAFSGWVLIVSGIFALFLAATVKLLPPDIRYLGMTMEELCARHACRIVHFMAHDRVSFGGSIISIGILYVWLASVPLRQGKAWAWWVFLISGITGFGSFLTYLGYGYLDEWHAIATLLLLPFFIMGLIWSYSSLERPRGPRALFRPGAQAWLWSPAGLGRICMTFTAIGMLMGGMIIMIVGMTRVFVPQDLEYMQVTVAQIDAINSRLIPLIAHDRAGFGGGLFSGGLAILLSLWCGARPGERGLWRALLLAGIIGFATAIGIHPIVGYTSFIHLAPAYAGAVAFIIGIVMLYGPMCRVDSPSDRFPDL